MQHLPQQNLLERESSPYLRQHAENPVHWRPWNAAALDEARQIDRPILLSVGYAACHWCHVMAHESFGDPDVAAVMNRLFVNIKVDREERPDIDQLYMAALTAMGEQGGWPLTMFLTPEGKPFWGGTYFPKQPRYGRPGFIQVLEAVARTWADKTDDLKRSAHALADHVQSRLAPDSDSGELTSELFGRHAEAIASMIDPLKGGLRGAPKFPNAPFMNLLWLSWLNTRNAAHRDAVLLSLREMLSGGIYDHIGGGLCRYATDADWVVPHFEKMLYDNAQLIDLCCLAYAETGDLLFRDRIEETVEWLQREMLLGHGAFASSLDADSEGIEGRFYLWTHDELTEVLERQEVELFLARYSLARPEGWEGDPILCRQQVEWNEGDAEALSDMRERLQRHRSKRQRPARDDKVLVDWNGLLIAALVRAGRLFERMDWTDLAAQAFRFISESQQDGRLPHALLGESRLFPGMATDYAAMISAAIALRQATGDAAYLKEATNWQNALERWYSDADNTGHYLSASDADDLPLRLRSDIDEATPSATAQIIVAFQALATATADHRLAERTRSLAEHALGRAARQNYGQAGILHASEVVRTHSKLVMADERNGNFVSEANRFPDPRRIDVIVPPSAAMTSVSLPDGTVIRTDSPGAWLCSGLFCRPPVHSASALRALLRSNQ